MRSVGEKKVLCVASGRQTTRPLRTGASVNKTQHQRRCKCQAPPAVLTSPAAVLPPTRSTSSGRWLGAASSALTASLQPAHHVISSRNTLQHVGVTLPSARRAPSASRRTQRSSRVSPWCSLTCKPSRWCCPAMFWCSRCPSTLAARPARSCRSRGFSRAGGLEADGPEGPASTSSCGNVKQPYEEAERVRQCTQDT